MKQHEKMVGLSLWARSCCDNDEALGVQFFNDICIFSKKDFYNGFLLECKKPYKDIF